MRPMNLSAAAVALSGFLLFAVTSSGSAQVPAAKKDEFQTSAPYAILIDADSGTVLFEKSADKLNPPASMSKLMTVEVVLHTIAEGKLKAWMGDVVLLNQSHVNADKYEGKTIEQLRANLSGTTGENVVIRRFSRFAVGA